MLFILFFTFIYLLLFYWNLIFIIFIQYIYFLLLFIFIHYILTHYAMYKVVDYIV